VREKTMKMKMYYCLVNKKNANDLFISNYMAII